MLAWGRQLFFTEVPIPLLPPAGEASSVEKPPLRWVLTLPSAKQTAWQCPCDVSLVSEDGAEWDVQSCLSRS